MNTRLCPGVVSTQNCKYGEVRSCIGGLLQVTLQTRSVNNAVTHGSMLPVVEMISCIVLALVLVCLLQAPVLFRGVAGAVPSDSALVSMLMGARQGHDTQAEGMQT